MSRLGEGPVKECLRRLANGRTLCNCQQAYQASADDRTCRHGCSTNQLYASREIAVALMNELNR